MNDDRNFFSFLELPISFSVDAEQLSNNVRELQKKLHPDRYAHLSAQEQRLAVQYTAFLNEAATTLKSPLLRAQYLLQLAGIDMENDTTTVADTAFLMQQMEWREQMESIAETLDSSLLEELKLKITTQLKQLRNLFEQQYQQSTLNDAVNTVQKMQFLEKQQIEIERLEDKLYDLD